MLQLRSRYVINCSRRDVLHELRCWLVRGDSIDLMHKLRVGLLPADLGLRLVCIVPRGLVLCYSGSHGRNGRVLGGPVLGIGCDGLQRMCERLLPGTRRAGNVHRVLGRSVQRSFSRQQGMRELRGR